MRTFARGGGSLFACLAALGVVAVALSSADPEAPVPAAPKATGTIAGTVRYTGAAPDPAVLQMAADPYCLNAHQDESVTAENLVVNADGTLRWVFVRIRETPAAGGAASAAESIVLDQVGCVYRPHVLGMQAGATLRVVNSDATLHNVNVQPANNPGFNVAQPIPGMATERSFANPEVMIMVRCDVHPWMQAFIGVVDHPFFDVTGEAGTFALDGVPAGEYVVEAWHESLGTLTATVTVRDGETATADFEFGAGS